MIKQYVQDFKLDKIYEENFIIYKITLRTCNQKEFYIAEKRPDYNEMDLEAFFTFVNVAKEAFERRLRAE